MSKIQHEVSTSIISDTIKGAALGAGLLALLSIGAMIGYFVPHPQDAPLMTCSGFLKAMDDRVQIEKGKRIEWSGGDVPLWIDPTKPHPSRSETRTPVTTEVENGYLVETYMNHCERRTPIHLEHVKK